MQVTVLIVVVQGGRARAGVFSLSAGTERLRVTRLQRHAASHTYTRIHKLRERKRAKREKKEGKKK